jgi:hypothetical protein
MMAFSCSSLSIMCDVRVACSAYAFRRAHGWVTTLLVLCCKLNKYLVYLAKCEHWKLNCGLVMSHTALWHCCHMGSPDYELGRVRWCVGGDDDAALTQHSESHVRHPVDSIINIIVDECSPEWCRGVKGYLHPDLTRIKAMGLKGMAVVIGDRPVVAESDESAQELSWEPRAMSARGPEEAILAECILGVVIQAHLKNSHETITNPKVINSEK